MTFAVTNVCSHALAVNANPFDVLGFASSGWDRLVTGIQKCTVPRANLKKARKTRATQSCQLKFRAGAVEGASLSDELLRIFSEANTEYRWFDEQLWAVHSDFLGRSPTFARESFERIIAVARSLILNPTEQVVDLAMMGWISVLSIRGGVEDHSSYKNDLLELFDAGLAEKIQIAASLPGSMSGIERFRAILGGNRDTSRTGLLDDPDGNYRAKVVELGRWFRDGVQNGSLAILKSELDHLGNVKTMASNRRRMGVIDYQILRPGPAVVRGLEPQLFASLLVPAIVLCVFISVLGDLDVTICLYFLILLVWIIGRFRPSKLL